MKKFVPALVSFLLISILIEILVSQGLIAETLLPAPHSIYAAFIELREDFIAAFLETLKNVSLGFSLSVIFGLLTAFIFSLSDLLKRAILPFAIFFQTVPIIAIAPLLVIYFGFGAPTVIASSFIVSLFPIIANTLIGLESISKSQKDLFKLYKASRTQTLCKLRVPQAYSHIYSGLKVSAGLSIIGAIAGEFVAGGGLGAMIDAARTQQRVDIVFTAILLLSFMGLIFVAVLNLLNAVLLSKRPYMNSSQN